MNAEVSVFCSALYVIRARAQITVRSLESFTFDDKHAKKLVRSAHKNLNSVKRYPERLAVPGIKRNKDTRLGEGLLLTCHIAYKAVNNTELHIKH